MANSKKRKNWLLPTTLILFILSVITLSLMAVVTYAWRSEDPTHLLTFENEKLTWDENTEVGENGVAHLSFFNTYYQNVNSENGDNVFAPGTEQDTLIRLKNNSDDEITYTAIAWMIKECDILELTGDFRAEGATPTNNYEGLLPPNVTPDDLLGVGAVTGTVSAKGIQDFDIGWEWIFERGDEVEPGIYESDFPDTYLGNKAAWDTADDSTIGFAIIVEGETPVPTPPTGQGSMIYWGIGLVAVAGIIFVAELIFYRRQKKKEEQEEA